ncbi:uncharacterized protein KY384_001965 [Bacidia gigantensis]|uniref:uncharacterized protein n=1 Tax=Bacidia gigantensis TaxID=2732470 RepID=UPI001D0492E8|nr:uncharacterized protein KY384_001965 [Bacidia gigantensis]KAG8533182.1 hypothetical protein KY384_001965 [Bacidia gigantensis]
MGDDSELHGHESKKSKSFHQLHSIQENITPGERDIPSTGKDPKRQKKRKSIGQQSKSRVRARNSPVAQRQPVKRGRPRVTQLDSSDQDIEGSIQDQLRRENADLEDHALARLQQSILPSVEPTEGTGFTPRQKKRKKRVSIGQQSHRKPKPLITVKEESLEAEPIFTDRVETDRSRMVGAGEYQDDHGNESQEDRSVSQTGHQKSRRKKRKSIGQQKRKKTSDGVRAPNTPTTGLSKAKNVRKEHFEASNSLRPSIERDNPEDDNSDSEEANADVISIPQPKAKRKAPSASQDVPKKKPSIKTQHISKSNSSSKALKPSKPSTTARSTSNKVPITVYRPPTPSSPASPGSLTDAPASKSFNPVDVLAQITLERLTNIATKLTSQPTRSRGQRRVLQLYTTEIEQRMRQLSKALDTNASLKVRVKKVAKEERELKKGVKEVEKEAKEARERREDLEKTSKRVEMEGVLRRIAEIARKGWEMERKKELLA